MTCFDKNKNLTKWWKWNTSNSVAKEHLWNLEQASYSQEKKIEASQTNLQAKIFEEGFSITI